MSIRLCLPDLLARHRVQRMDITGPIAEVKQGRVACCPRLTPAPRRDQYSRTQVRIAVENPMDATGIGIERVHFSIVTTYKSSTACDCGGGRACNIEAPFQSERCQLFALQVR